MRIRETYYYCPSTFCANSYSMTVSFILHYSKLFTALLTTRVASKKTVFVSNKKFKTQNTYLCTPKNINFFLNTSFNN